MKSPERLMHLARYGPIRRGSACISPQLGATPTHVWVSAKVAVSEAMRKSPRSASSIPHATAGPLTAVMIGIGQVAATQKCCWGLVQTKPPRPSSAAVNSSGPSPAEKVRPTPVSTMARMARMARSCERSCSALASSETSARLSALSLCGLLSVSVTSGPTTTTCK